jgi:putative hemolysin
MTFLINVLIITVGLFFSAFFSSAEIAYTAVAHAKLERAVQQGNKQAEQALKISKNFDQYSSALLFGNGVVNIFISSLATVIALQYLSPMLGNNVELSTVIISVIMFFLIVIFGELIPKVVGRQFSFMFSTIYVIPVSIVRFLFYPIVYLLSFFVRLVSWVWIRGKKEDHLKFNDDELEKMVDVIEEKGLIDEKKGDLIRSAIIFSETKAYEVMTPRIHIFGFDITDPLDHLYRLPDTFTYSKLPVYDQTLDKIIGILPTKKLYESLLNNKMIELTDFLLEVLYVPRTQPISSVLELFKETKQSMAIVVDEHGGTEGLITLEDIIEEIVGEIWDETDEIMEHLIKQNEHEYLVEGSMNAEDFFNTLSLPYEETADFTTVSGWVLNQLEEFAKVGDSFSYHHAVVNVLEVEKFTVEKIKVTLTLEEEGNN